MKWPLAANVAICAAAAGCAQSPSVSEGPSGGAKGQADAAIAPRDGAALDSKIPLPDIDGPSSEDGREAISSGDAGESGAAPNDAPDVQTLDAGIAEASGDSTDDAAEAARDAASDNAAEAARDAASDNAAEAGRDAATCANGVTSISNIGTNDFHISFRITTSQKDWVALVNQRGACYAGVYWDIRQCGAGPNFCPADGELFVETEGAANGSYQSFHSAGTINDGNPHNIEVARVLGMLTIRIDGALSGMGPSPAFLGAMPALRIGTDACAMANPPTADLAAGTTLSNLCITSP